MAYINNNETAAQVRGKINQGIVIPFNHTKVSNVHNLTGSINSSGLTYLSFKATSNFNLGDLFSINGINVPAKTQKDENLTKDFFKVGCIILAVFDGARLHFSNSIGIRSTDETVNNIMVFPAGATDFSSVPANTLICVRK